MTKSDVAYYRQRAEQERELARTATDPAAAGIHLSLAEQYERLLSEKNGSPTPSDK